MESMDEASMRYKVLECAKDFKTSWIKLGQLLYTVYKDKLYKDWEYSTFEAYVANEIGIKKPTAIKLLRSYYFLENEAPKFVKKDFTDETAASKVPSFEAVDALRLASSNRNIAQEDYARIKEAVLEKGKAASGVKKDIASIVRHRLEEDGEEARKKRRVVLIKRLLSALRSINKEAKISKLLSGSIIKDTEDLIGRLENEIHN